MPARLAMSAVPESVFLVLQNLVMIATCVQTIAVIAILVPACTPTTMPLAMTRMLVLRVMLVTKDLASVAL
jgi:hypothetical protein